MSAFVDERTILVVSTYAINLPSKSLTAYLYRALKWIGEYVAPVYLNTPVISRGLGSRVSVELQPHNVRIGNNAIRINFLIFIQPTIFFFI